jgi:hypothetical protein
VHGCACRDFFRGGVLTQTTKSPWRFNKVTAKH